MNGTKGNSNEDYSLSHELAILFNGGSRVKAKLSFPYPTIEEINRIKNGEEKLEKEKLKEFFESVYYLDLSQISLYNEGEFEKKLKGLKNFKNLEEIDLSNSKYTQKHLESIIKLFPKLESIKLNTNKIENFDIFKDTKIVKISLRSSNLNDEKLEKLTTLLPNLTHLDISNNKTSNTYSRKDGKYQMVKIEGITKIKALEKLKNLKHLVLDALEITSLEGIENLTNLEYLSLSSIKKPKNGYNNNFDYLADFSSINNFTKLTYLNISYSKLKNLDFLKNKKFLNTLYMEKVECEENCKNSLHVIKDLSNLTKFICHDVANLFDDISFLDGLDRLSYVAVNGTNIKKVGFKDINYSIRYIDCSNTQISDETFLNQFAKIKSENSLKYSATPLSRKNKTDKYKDAGEISYFDGKTYIIDHYDHYHKLEMQEKEKDTFYHNDIKDNSLFHGAQVIGFTKEGYFVKKAFKKDQKYKYDIYEIYYLKGFPEYKFIFPNYKEDKDAKPSDDLLDYILQKTKENVEKNQNNKDQIEKILKENNDKINQINKLNELLK